MIAPPRLEDDETEQVDEVKHYSSIQFQIFQGFWGHYDLEYESNTSQYLMIKSSEYKSGSMKFKFEISMKDEKGVLKTFNLDGQDIDQVMTTNPSSTEVPFAVILRPNVLGFHNFNDQFSGLHRKMKKAFKFYQNCKFFENMSDNIIFIVDPNRVVCNDNGVAMDDYFCGAMRWSINNVFQCWEDYLVAQLKIELIDCEDLVVYMSDARLIALLEQFHLYPLRTDATHNKFPLRILTPVKLDSEKSNEPGGSYQGLLIPKNMMVKPVGPTRSSESDSPETSNKRNNELEELKLIESEYKRQNRLESSDSGEEGDESKEDSDYDHAGPSTSTYVPPPKRKRFTKVSKKGAKKARLNGNK